MEINLFKYFTLRRLINTLKVLISYNVAVITKKPLVWGMPVSYSIEPTNHCNLKCPECPSGLGSLTRPLGLMKSEFFEKLIDEISGEGFYLQLYFQGEPYINKNLPGMIRYAQKKRMYVSISTNGHFITKNNADEILRSAPDKIIYSIDGLDEKSYQNYRVGGTFAKADEGLRSLIDRKRAGRFRKPFVELQFIVMKQNEHLLEKVQEYGMQAGVDKVVFKTMQVTSYSNALLYLPENKLYRRYEIEKGTFRVKGKIKNRCFALWRTSVITWDGKVVPCCFDKDADYELGTINGHGLKKIWSSANYREFRQKVLNNRKNIDMCSNCTAGMKMNILEVEQ